MEENIITSPQNARVKHVVALQQKSSLRREEGLFVVEGQREIEHCIACGYEIVELFTSQGVRHFVSCDLTKCLTPCEVTFKIRHTPGYLPATLEPTGEGSFIVHAKEKIHGVAPGQFCVIYDENHHRCYGSGEITI